MTLKNKLAIKTNRDTISFLFLEMSVKPSFQDKVYNAVAGKRALEIGGPSKITFNDLMPFYDMIESVDITVYAKDTVWNSANDVIVLPNGKEAKFFVDEGTMLKTVEDESFDVLAASHTLEHIANPIKALLTWKRVLKKGGYMLLILPWKQATFDHNRPITSLSTLMKKYQDNVGEDDLSCLDEILALHDLSMDPPAGNFEQFKERSLKNFENRCLHVSVFDFSLLKQLCHFIEMEWCGYALIRPENQYVLFKKI